MYIDTSQALPVFIAGFLFMIFFSLWFFFHRQKKPNYQSAFLVTSITSLSYLILIEGSITWLSLSGDIIYYTRWLFYIASCSILMVTISKLMKVKQDQVLSVLILNGLVMLSGAVSAIISSPFKWLVFGLGCLFFIAQLIVLYQNCPKNNTSRMVTYYIIFGWAMFPVVFIFAPEGLNLINNFFAAFLYLLLDLFTKVAFYAQLKLKPKE